MIVAGVDLFLGASVADSVLRTVVIEDPAALVTWLTQQHPEALQVDPQFLAALAHRGLIVASDAGEQRFDLIAPSGAIVPGVWIKAPELPEGEGTAEPEDIDA